MVAPSQAWTHGFWAVNPPQYLTYCSLKLRQRFWWLIKWAHHQKRCRSFKLLWWSGLKPSWTTDRWIGATFKKSLAENNPTYPKFIFLRQVFNFENLQVFNCIGIIVAPCLARSSKYLHIFWVNIQITLLARFFFFQIFRGMADCKPLFCCCASFWLHSSPHGDWMLFKTFLTCNEENKRSKINQWMDLWKLLGFLQILFPEF